MNRSTQVALLVTTLALAACGGGGSDDPGAQPPSPTASPTPAARDADVNNVQFAESQTAANTAVSTLNAAVADIQSVGNAPGGAPGGAISLPVGPTASSTVNCSVSGNFTYTYEYSNAGIPVSYSYTYNNCRYGTPTAYLEYNGTGRLDYINYTSATDYGWTLTYNITYSYVSTGYNYNGTLNFTQRCTNSGGNVSCNYQVGNNGVTNIQVGTVGNITTITRATVRSGNVTATYTNWVYDSSLRRATSGSIVVSDGNGNSITVEATGSGYRVTIVYAGRSTVYTVSV